MLVYGVLYAVIFGVSIWLLAFENESPTNWVLYAALGVAVLAAVVKFAMHSRKTNQQAV